MVHKFQSKLYHQFIAVQEKRMVSDRQLGKRNQDFRVANRSAVLSSCMSTSTGPNVNFSGLHENCLVYLTTQQEYTRKRKEMRGKEPKRPNRPGIYTKEKSIPLRKISSCGLRLTFEELFDREEPSRHYK